MLPIQVVFEYMNLSDNEKRIVLSVSEKRQAAAILSKKQLLPVIPQSVSIEERLELQLESYAKGLREYTYPLLEVIFLDGWQSGNTILRS